MLTAFKVVAAPTKSQTNPLDPINVIYKTVLPDIPERNQLGNQTLRKVGQSPTQTRTDIRIPDEALRQYLLSKKSPLAPYASRLLESPYWSTIVGICTIEQYGCSKAPGFSPYNFWGIMCRGTPCKYESYEGGIDAIDSLLERYEGRGKDTIEELNGYYVVPASQNWYNTVIKTKNLLENLP